MNESGDNYKVDPNIILKELLSRDDVYPIHIFTINKKISTTITVTKTGEHGNRLTVNINRIDKIMDKYELYDFLKYKVIYLIRVRNESVYSCFHRDCLPFKRAIRRKWGTLHAASRLLGLQQRAAISANAPHRKFERGEFHELDFGKKRNQLIIINKDIYYLKK